MEATDSISSEDGMKGDLTSSKSQVKRSDEGAQLLLPAETKVADGIAGSGAVSNSGKKNTFHFNTINLKAFSLEYDEFSATVYLIATICRRQLYT